MGRATALRLAQEGANVVVTDVPANERLGRELVSKIEAESKANGSGAKAVFVPLDVTREAQWGDAVAAAEKEFGPLDVAFLNAGIGSEPQWEVAMENHPTDVYERIMAVNVTGVYYGMKAVVRSMAKRDKRIKETASIIVTASVAGASGTLGPFAYTMSKHACMGLVKWAAIDLSTRNIRVNALQPGAIDTNIFDGLNLSQNKAAMDAVAGMEPIGRMADPDEMARVVTFLASDESSYVTGAGIVADGGLLAVNGLRSGLYGIGRH
ncbi:hypothetical protein DFJ74DRAFT_652895, partial [Hyaloraphidium curvatum]